jgi:AAA domain
VEVVDRGLFPPQAVADPHPMPEPSACSEPTDARRLRAMAARALDAAAAEDGHTLLPQEALASRIAVLPIRPAPELTEDIFRAVGPDMEPLIKPLELEGGVPAWQLHDFVQTKRIISDRVSRRVGGRPLVGNEDWRALVDRAIREPPPVRGSSPRADRDIRARAEKTEALAAVHAARLSIVIGPAGTGKTTLLKALLLARDVQNGGALLLAPTGKARVQLQRKAARDGATSLAQAKTIAQFLLPTGRYDGSTGAYRVTNAIGDREGGFRTVIIDEASMHQLAATLDAIDTGQVSRLVLVGDPRQLPPIGAGRPFVDIYQASPGADAKTDRRRCRRAADDHAR